MSVTAIEEVVVDWPNDALGNELRQYKTEGLDFSKEYEVGFSIDFDHWPLSNEKIESIKDKYDGCKFFDPTDEDIKFGYSNGYVIFTIKLKLSYIVISQILKATTEETKRFGGCCKGWLIVLDHI